MRSLIFSLLYFFCFSQVLGQTGNYFLSHFSPNNEEIDHLSFDIAQDGKGVLYFANKAGILEFDGRNWSMVPATAPIYTITISESGDIFAGGLSGFGKMVIEGNVKHFESLSTGIANSNNVFQSITAKDKVCFLTNSGLFILNPATSKVETTIVPTKDHGLFKNLFEIDGEIYVNTESDEIYMVKADKLERSQFNPSAGEILFTQTLLGSKKILVGTSADRVFLYESGSIQEIAIKDVDYLHSNVLVGGAWVNDFLVALGTLRGGVMFVNPATGETQEITNYYTGLPDNEVFAMLGDNREGIWVAHDYGYTRIAPFLPFRTFNHYPGIEGNLLCAYSSKNEVYVGTTLGLFKLVKDEIYEEEAYFVTRKSKAVAQKSEPAEEVAEPATTGKTKRGLFGIGRKKDKKKKGETPPAETTKAGAGKAKASKAVPQTVNTRERRTRRVLKSLQYRYAKVEGINGKVTHLMEVDGKLMAAGIGGVFIIDDLKSSMVSQDPVRAIFRSPSLNQVFISTYNEEIKSFKHEGIWRETHMLDTVQEYVTYMFEDKLQNLWLCGRAGVLKVEMIDNEITNIDRIPYLKASIDETVGLAVGSDVYVVNAGEFQLFDNGNDQFVKYDSLPGTRKYFASAGAFWFHDGHRWRTIDNRVTQSMQLDWLGIFSDIRYLAPADGSAGLWVITSSNELYRFTPSEKERPTAYPLFLKGVRGPELGSERAKLTIEEEKGPLTFQFVQPDYNGVQAIEYRYLLGGMTDIWSTWSPSNNEVTFPYLPSGDYEIRVQSMNLFGKVSELEKIYFSVLPPYWRQPWFYAMEVAFFSMLVLLSVRLSVYNQKYKPVSRVLSLLTVIMFIQLVQTSVYSLIELESSPVVEFLIQVFIALLVLPLEVKLRTFMERASEGEFDVSKLFLKRAGGVDKKDDNV